MGIGTICRRKSAGGPCPSYASISVPPGELCKERGINPQDRDASASLTSSLKALLTENFAILRGRGSDKGVWIQVPESECGYRFDFFSLSKVEKMEPPLYARIAKSFSDTIAPGDRLSERDVVVYLRKKEGFDSGSEESDLWWIRKRSAAATLINLDLEIQDLARRSAKANR